MRTTRSTVAIIGAVVATLLAFVVATPSSAAAATRKTTTTVAVGTAYSGLRASLAAHVSPTPPGGVVTMSADGKALSGCSRIKISSGRARCTATFATGKHTVYATYSGTTGYARSTGHVTKTVTRGTGKVVGGVGSCTTTKGALVAVDFRNWSGPIVRGCGGLPSTGLKLMNAAGFKTTGTQHDGPAFVCRIATAAFQRGAAYPTSTQEKCQSTPPASKYWSFWLAKKGASSWTYSKLGAASDKPANGEVEAWKYAGNDSLGKPVAPSFTPAQARVGMPEAKTVQSSTTRHAAVATGSSAPDLGKAIGYLTSSTNLVDGTHYEPFGAGFTDYGLTMDGGFALAASGADDAALKKITDYVETNGDTYTGIGTEFADGGAIGKEALLAEVTGHDPRNFNGHDLIAALDSLVCTGADSNGCAAAGMFRNAGSTFSQALGVLAQLRANDTTGSATTMSFLAGQQHSDGSFPSVLPGNDSEVDSTAMAAMALAKSPGSTIGVDNALAWIAGQQENDGGFPGASGDSTNSAALAVQALSLGGSTYRSQITKGAGFLADEQNSDGGFDVSAGTDGSDLRASTQAVSGAVGTPLGSLTDDITTTPAHSDVQAGADYLTGKLIDGDHLEFDGGFGPNYGGSADLAIALAAAGQHDAALAKIVRYLAVHVDEYVDPQGKGDFPGPYTGAAGKLAVLAEITGQDPTDFGGVDLLKVLTDNVCTAADTSGACTAPGDFYQVFSTTGQALDVLALARAGHTVPAAAVSRLESLQCDDGGFASLLVTDGQTCTSEVDSTGFAVQALSQLSDDQDAAQAVTQAVAYLRGSQQTDGGWNGASGESSNSTALAIQGLLAAPASADFGATPPLMRGVRPAVTRADPAVKKAQAFLAGLQNTDGGFDISTEADGSDVAATTQSVAAAANATLSKLERDVVLPGGGSGSGSGGGSGSGSGNGSGSGSGSGSSGSGSGSGSNGSGSGSGGSTGSTGSSSSAGDDSLADTGVHSSELLGYAALLLLGGGALTIAGRRRRGGSADELTTQQSGTAA